METCLHIKPTDSHQYLWVDSCHPKHCKTAIPYSQALCLQRICSEEENVVKRIHELKEYFLKQGVVNFIRSCSDFDITLLLLVFSWGHVIAGC